MRDDRSISECLILESDGEPYKEYDINHVGQETWTKGYICSVISLVLELSLQNSRINVVQLEMYRIYAFVDIDSQTRRKCKACWRKESRDVNGDVNNLHAIFSIHLTRCIRGANLLNEKESIEKFLFAFFLPCLRPATEEEYPEQDVPPACAGWSVALENASPSRAADDWRTTWPNSRVNCRHCSANWYSISRIREAWDWDLKEHLQRNKSKNIF